MNHYLTYKDEKSDKFWSIEVNDNSHTVTYGKTGTKGTAKTKTFDTAEKCLADATKSLKGKLKKGYIENGIEKVGETVKVTEVKTLEKIEKEEVAPSPKQDNASTDAILPTKGDVTSYLTTIKQLIFDNFLMQATDLCEEISKQKLSQEELLKLNLFKGTIAFKMKNYETAKEVLLKSDSAGYFLLAETYKALEEYTNAYSYYEKVATYDALYTAATMAINIKDPKTAITYSTLAVKEGEKTNHPELWKAHHLWVQALQKSENPNLELQEQVFTKAIAHPNAVVKVYNDFALFYKNQKNYDQAHTLLDLAIKKFPEEHLSYYNQCACFMDTEQHKEALDALEKAYQNGYSKYYEMNNDGPWNILKTYPKGKELSKTYTYFISNTENPRRSLKKENPRSIRTVWMGNTTGNRLDDKTIPSDITKFKNLEELNIYYSRLKTIPSVIGELKKLKKIVFWGHQIVDIPENILSFNYERVELVLNKVKEFPSYLTKLKGLKLLSIDSSTMTDLPKEIALCKQLESLDLYCSKMESISEEIASLPDLKKIHINSTLLIHLPIALTKMRNLEAISIHNNSNIKYLSEEIFALPNLKNISLSGNNFPDEEAEQLFTEYHKKLNKRQLGVFLAILQSNASYIKFHLQPEDIFKAIDTSISLLRTNALILLGQKEIINPLTADAHVLVLGKFSIKVNEIKNIIKRFGAKTVSKYSPKVTHVVLGENPGDKLLDILDKDVQWLTEKYLNNPVEKDKEEVIPVLKVSDTTLNKIETLLLSTEEHNIYLALDMIKTGNLTHKFKEELFITYQFTSSKENKASILSLIKKLKNEPLQKLFAKRYGFTSASEKKINKYIKEICDLLTLDKNRFAFAIVNKTLQRKPTEYLKRYSPVRGLTHFFENNVPKYIKKTLELFITGDTFSLDCDSYLQDLPKEILDYNLRHLFINAPLDTIPKIIMKMTTLKSLAFHNRLERETELPIDFKNLKGLEKLNIRGTSHVKLPDQFNQLTSLKELNFTMYGMEEFPIGITKLQNLEKLTIGFVSLEKIPEEITNLNKLTYLNLETNANGSAFAPFIDQLKSIQHLSLNINCDTDVLKIAAKLSNLTKLELHGRHMNFPSDVLELTQLEELYIKHPYAYDSANSFKKIPHEIQNLKELKKITIKGFPLEEFSSKISELPKLTSIDISNNFKNSFNKFPEVITNIPSLEELTISINQFEVFKKDFASLNTLKKLKITFDEHQDINTIVIKATIAFPHCEVIPIAEDTTYTSLNLIENLSDKKSEKLVVKNAIVSIPDKVNALQGLKELIITNSVITSVSPSIFQLTDTFIFFEKITPSYIQEIPVLIHDVQQKNISSNQAEVYLHLLQGNYKVLSKEQLIDIINALDYSIENIRLSAIEYLEKLLPIATNAIEKNSVITVLGNCTTFSKSEIKKRLKKLGLSMTTSLNDKTTHLILGTKPNLKEQQLDLSKIQITTERNFKEWLDTADKQLMSVKTEESSDAIANISEMLLSANEENIQLAIQMMKTHGAGSKELLTALCIFYNDYELNLSQGNRTKARNLFKKNASKKLLEFIGDDPYLGNDISFYRSLQKNQLLDPMKIAFHRNESIYYTLLQESRKEKK